MCIYIYIYTHVYTYLYVPRCSTRRRSARGTSAGTGPAPCTSCTRRFCGSYTHVGFIHEALLWELYARGAFVGVVYTRRFYMHAGSHAACARRGRTGSGPRPSRTTPPSAAARRRISEIQTIIVCIGDRHILYFLLNKNKYNSKNTPPGVEVPRRV